MMKKNSLFLSIIVIANSSLSFLLADTVVVTDPVIEMSSSFPPPNPGQPISPEHTSCRRAHQAVANELWHVVQKVTINTDSDKQTCLDLISDSPIIYGIDAEKNEPRRSLWAVARGIMFLRELGPDLIAALPDTGYGISPTVVLIFPWKNFSVGTRFRHCSDRDTESSYAIMVPDYTAQKATIQYVPKQDALIEQKRTEHDARAIFVSLLKNLIKRMDEKNCVIPFVWGGSSFITGHEPKDFYLVSGKAWERSGKEGNFYTGYDASELIMRFARIAGLYFPWKTTAVMAEKLEQYGKNDELQVGDIIRLSRGALIITDLENNKAVGAFGYSSGYGCVKEVDLSSMGIAGVSSYDDLLELYRKQGQSNFTLLKLCAQK